MCLTGSVDTAMHCCPCHLPSHSHQHHAKSLPPTAFLEIPPRPGDLTTSSLTPSLLLHLLPCQPVPAVQQLRRENCLLVVGTLFPVRGACSFCHELRSLERKRKTSLSSLFCSALLVPVENEKKRVWGGRLKKK